MIRSTSTRFAALAVLAALLTAPTVASADSPRPLAESLDGSAKTDYDIARILFRDGDFAGALVKYQSAYEHSKDPRLQYNVAACERNLHHYARALRAMARYQEATLSEEDRKEATEVVEALRRFVGTLVLTSAEVGASVVVDGEEVGTLPLPSPLTLDFGKHTIRVQKPGYDEQVLDVEVSDTRPLQRAITLEKAEGRLIVTARAQDRIDVDGRFVGTGRLEVSLPYGGHQLKVTAPGYRTYQSEVIVQSKDPRTVNVALEKEKTTGLPWWVWVVGGGVVLAGGGAVTYFALQSSSSSSTTTNNGRGFTPVPGSGGTVVVSSF